MTIAARIKKYWDQRADDYSQHIQKELNLLKREAWQQLIKEYAPKGEKLAVLDVGTGPGFLSIILSAMGNEVTAVDSSENMLEEAKKNISKAGFAVRCQQADAQKLPFPEDTFDLIICRNLVWTLPDPLAAYQDWYRVLKPGGRVLVFDANWGLRFNDSALQRQYEDDQSRAKELGYDNPHDKANLQENESISKNLFLSSRLRPNWDVEAFLQCQYKKVFLDRDITDLVWDEQQKVLYRSTPMFIVGGEKE
ncbi:MAG: class I SAM-dependent methyltransferase [Clostridium sp.]|uniref:class I SAM-dependent methyltransferase n=1 Tax=Desulfosporosinus sp. TaxID=157907 RepID=UPI001BBE0526|nr:class I SAM-dependent methyltransferase [Desulfosporosinus sp.]MBS4008328.1 class I SAM-dependent methyltransferase [Clostridium sp.]